MGAKEALRFLAERPLVSDTEHAVATKAHTNSIGFCFWIDDTNKSYQHALYEASKHLSGITYLQVAVIGDLVEPRADSWKKSWGRYADFPMRDELCTRTYSKADFTQWAIFTPEPRQITGTILDMLIPTSSADWLHPELVVRHD